MEGRKELLGLYLSESEGANYYLSILMDLNNRGLKNFPKALTSIYPETEVQHCIIHQIRNSLR